MGHPKEILQKNTKAKVTPLGGIHLIHTKLIPNKVIQFIDNELGNRKVFAKYKY